MFLRFYGLSEGDICKPNDRGGLGGRALQLVNLSLLLQDMELQ